MKLTTENTKDTERATPETDALEQKQSSEGCPQWNDMMRWVREHASLARKLERERDEAREQNAKLRNIAKRAIEAIPHTEGYGEFSYAAAILRAELKQLKEEK
jgi:hypothetical protein